MPVARKQSRESSSGARKETLAAMDYTIDELMVVTLARQFTDADIMLNGTVSYIPVSAFMLARETHAPKLTWVAGAVGVDADPGFIVGNTLDPTMWKAPGPAVTQSPHPCA